MTVILFFISFVLTSSQASEVTTALEQYLKVASLPVTPAVVALEEKIAELVVDRCYSSHLQDELECVITGVPKICESQTKMNAMNDKDCLSWGDLFAAIFTSRRSLLSAADLWRFRDSSPAIRVVLTRRICSQRAVELEESFKMAATPCDPGPTKFECEAQAVEKFCLRYARFHPMSAFVCSALVIKGRKIPIY